MLRVKLLPKQWEVFNADKGVDYDIKLYQGGVGCVDGDTLISLADGSEIKIKDFEGGLVLAWDGESLTPAYATKAASYSPKQLFEVKTTDGLKITCTAEHRFLSPSGAWVQTSHLQAGDAIFSSLVPQGCRQLEPCVAPLGHLSAPIPQLSNLEHALSAHALGAGHCAQTPLDCQGDYSVYPHQYDGQLLSGRDTGLIPSPSQADAPSHSQRHLHWGGQAYGLSDTHSCLSFDLHSRKDYDSLMGNELADLALYYADDSISGPPLQSSPQLRLSPKSLTPGQLARLFAGPSPSQLCYSPLNLLLNRCLAESVIESIKPIKVDCYYDLHVPGYNNYLAHGFINHNSGKTFLGSLVGLSVLSANPGATWLVGADTGVRLKLTTCETYLELLDSAKIRHKHNKTDKILRIPGWDDARIIFKGLEDPEALRSVNGIGGHLEEASLLPERSYLEFLGRLRQAKPGTPIRIILTTNPEAQKGWLFDHFFENAGLITEMIRDNPITVSRRRVIARTLDNPYVSDAFIATLKASYDPELYRIMVLGQDGDYTRGLVNHSFSDLNVRETEYKPELDIYLTCDFNVDPMSWALAHRYNGEYHFFDEIVIANTNINECIDEFVKRYPSHEGNLIITGDASGNSRNVQNEQVGGTCYTQIVNRLTYHSYRAKARIDVREMNPAIMDRVSAWNAMVCNTDGVRRVIISPRCTWLIWNCHNLKFKEGTAQIDEPTHNDIKKDPKRKYTKHVWDAASYLIEKYDPIVLKTIQKKEGIIVPKALRKSRI